MLFLNVCSGLAAVFLPLYIYKVFLLLIERKERKQATTQPVVQEVEVAELALA